MSSVDKIKWAMSLRDPQYEALKCFDIENPIIQ